MKLAMWVLAFLFPFQALAGVPLSNTPITVANTTALQALPILAAQGGLVIRTSDGMSYAPSGSACSISGGNGITQIPSADGNCWLAVVPTGNPTFYGCKGDGVANDAACMQTAINAQAPNGILRIDRVYKINSALTVPAGVKILGPYHGPGHGQVNPVAATCTAGFRAGTANINLLSFTGDGSEADGICIDNVTISNTSGASIFVGANNVHVKNTQIEGGCIGIDVTSTSGNNNVGAVLAFNTIIPANNTGCAGTRIGNQSTGALTTEVHIDHDETYCNASSAYGTEILDVGGLYISGADNGLNCLYGTYIKPGVNQNVTGVFVASSVLGDSSQNTDLVIDTGAASSIVSLIDISASWAASARSGPSVTVANSATGVVTGVHLSNMHILPAVANNGINITGGNDVTLNGAWVCTGAASSGTSAISVSSPGVVSLSNNTIGGCDSSGGGLAVTGLTYTASGGIVTLTDNTFTAVTTPITWSPATPPVRANIHDNIGIDDNPTTVASAASIAAPVNPEFVVSGTAAISTITNVWPARRIIIRPSGAFTLVSGGNILVPSTITATVGIPLYLFYEAPNWLVK